MLSLHKSFQYCAKYGVVPSVEKNENLVQANSFYRSLDYVGSVPFPAKNAARAIVAVNAYALINIVLQDFISSICILIILGSKGIIKNNR